MSLVLFTLCVPAAHAGRRDPEAEYYANAYADHYGLPRALVYAIIPQESGWNPYAVSPKGARGLMQLMPATAQRYSVQNIFSKRENIGGGSRYLRDLMRECHGDLRLVVAAYYAGERRVLKHGLSLKDPEVIAYVEQVRRRYLLALQRYPSSVPERQR